MKGCILDRGSLYRTEEVVNALRHYGMRQSIERIGCCYDNSAAESYFRNLKMEPTFSKTLESSSEVGIYIFDLVRYSITEQECTPDSIIATRQSLNFCALMRKSEMVLKNVTFCPDRSNVAEV